MTINKLWNNALKGELHNKDLIKHEQNNFFKDCPKGKEHIILFVLCWNNGFKYKSVVFEGIPKILKEVKGGTIKK